MEDLARVSQVPTGPLGLGTSAAGLARRHREAAETLPAPDPATAPIGERPAEPPVALPPLEPAAGRLTARLSEAMVETATWLDNETVKLGRVKQGPLRVQRLRYPFPSRISPYAQDAQAHCAQWVVDHELVDDGELDRFNSFEIGICAARLFPETTAVGRPGWRTSSRG
jgi:hypothetical protein